MGRTGATAKRAYVMGVRSMTAEEWMARLGDWFVPEPNSGCWLWIRGSVTHDGYGYQHTGPGRKSIYAHRLSYSLMRGEIPPGMQVDHLCRTPLCVNPDHLEAVTPKVNNARSGSPPATNARKTHCKRGHALTPDNLYIGSSGERVCRTCRLAWAKADYERRRTR